MNIEMTYACREVDWHRVPQILATVGMGHYSPERHRRAFEASYCTVFLYDENNLVGFGRAISDGQYQAALYDCAILPAYQGLGLGRRVVQEILAKLPECHIILYASPGKEGFYEKQGFRKMKTGMARFVNAAAMQQRGFTQ